MDLLDELLGLLDVGLLPSDDDDITGAVLAREFDLGVSFLSYLEMATTMMMTIPHGHRLTTNYY